MHVLLGTTIQGVFLTTNVGIAHMYHLMQSVIFSGEAGFFVFCKSIVFSFIWNLSLSCLSPFYNEICYFKFVGIVELVLIH